MEKLSHAYIVSSVSAEKSRAKAVELASEMLCTAAGKRPCGVCRDCRKIKAGVHPDVAFISRLADGEGNKKRDIQIAQIRQMSADAVVLPNEASGKVYIIEEADTMNESSQNAALKLFEEPPKNVCFILCAVNPDRLLPTVRSRCAFVRCNCEEDAFDEKTEALADEYITKVLDANEANLFAWLMENSEMESRKLAEFLNCTKAKLVQMLRYSDAKKRIMENIELIDRCLEYQTVNTGVKQILGLLAVRSVPAKEMRKKVD